MTIFITPLVIYMFMSFFHWTKKTDRVFLFLGKHSMNMWLIHSFFCFYYLQPYFLSLSHHPIPVLILLIAVSLASSILLDFIWYGVGRLFGKLKDVRG